ncbi:hypothetical protein FWH13_00510 [Candidatus Saccharibacteria bacterium]|nr:hypothetical protein [Candidatus Saccharibacteria bacterium]
MKKALILGIATLGVAALIAAPALAAPAPATWNQTVQVTSNSVITISSTASNPITITADPTLNGGFGTVAVPLTVSSNNESGYNLTLSMVSTDANNGALFDATSTTTDVVAGIPATGTLVANQWGYNSVVGSNTVPTIASSFSQVPAAATPVTLLNVAVEGTSDVFVNYGAVIDYTLPSGITYSNQVTYTASVNP